LDQIIIIALLAIQAISCHNLQIALIQVLIKNKIVGTKVAKLPILLILMELLMEIQQILMEAAQISVIITPVTVLIHQVHLLMEQVVVEFLL